MLSTIQLNNLRSAAAYAFECEKRTQIPCELILAQWALESGWGQHSPGNNCFGIKQYDGCQGVQLLYTTEYFTPREMDTWVNAVGGRCANLQDATPSKTGKQRYQVQDWFASFKTLADCFEKRASLFSSSLYAPYLAQYQIDHNIVRLVQGVAKHYATDPNYSYSILDIAGLREVQDAIKMVRG